MQSKNAKDINPGDVVMRDGQVAIVEFVSVTTTGNTIIKLHNQQRQMSVSNYAKFLVSDKETIVAMVAAFR